MSDTAFDAARCAIQEVAGPCPGWGRASVKDMLGRVHAKLGYSTKAIREVWQRERLSRPIARLLAAQLLELARACEAFDAERAGRCRAHAGALLAAADEISAS